MFIYIVPCFNDLCWRTNSYTFRWNIAIYYGMCPYNCSVTYRCSWHHDNAFSEPNF